MSSPGIEPGSFRLGGGCSASRATRTWYTRPESNRLTNLRRVGPRIRTRVRGTPRRSRTFSPRFVAAGPESAGGGMVVSSGEPACDRSPGLEPACREHLGGRASRSTRFKALPSGHDRWSRRRVSNPLPPAYQAGALPVVLRRRGGAEGSRTLCLLLAKQALSQLSYSPVVDRRGNAPRVLRLQGGAGLLSSARAFLVGPAGAAPAAFRVSGGRSAGDLRTLSTFTLTSRGFASS